MKSKTRTQVHIETHETIIVRRANRFPAAQCATCGVEVRTFSPEQAASITQTTAREIYRRIEDGSLHPAGVSDADLAVCSQSLKSNHQPHLVE